MLGVAKLARGDGHVGLYEAPEPTIRPGFVIIEVKAAGVCGTDMHIYHDEFPTDPPVIMGHELSGVVAEVGKGVTRVQVGDRVTSETFFHYCGVCDFCRNGKPNLCLERKSIGSGVNGAFAKYLLVPERIVHKLPDNVSFLAGALTEPTACMVHALELSRVDPWDVVVVAGPGAVGLNMAQIVQAAGAEVILLGTTGDKERMEVAKTMGIETTVDVLTEDSAAIVADMTDGRMADVAFECSGAGPSAQNCLNLLHKGGRYAQVGLFGKPITWDLEAVLVKEIKVSGSFSHVPSAWPRALRMMAKGQVQTEPLATNVFTLKDWEQAFAKFEAREGLKNILVPE